MWSSGPSSLIGSKIFLVEKKFMKGLPIIKTTSNEVKTASPVLTVKYLNTFKKVKTSIKSKINKYNIMNFL